MVGMGIISKLRVNLFFLPFLVVFCPIVGHAHKSPIIGLISTIEQPIKECVGSLSNSHEKAEVNTGDLRDLEVRVLNLEISSQNLRTFTDGGFLKLLEMANREKTDIEGFLEQTYRRVVALKNEFPRGGQQPDTSFKQLDQMQLAMLKYLAKSKSLKQKLNSQKLQIFRHPMKWFHKLAFEIVTFEVSIYGSSTLQPLESISGDQIEAIYNTLAEIEFYKHNLNEKETIGGRNTDTQGEVVGASNLNLGHGSNEISDDQLDKGLPENHLSVAIEEKTLLPYKTYVYQNHKGTDYEITFSNEVVKESFKVSEKDAIFKLLGTLRVGNGSYSGLKFLNRQAGAQVVEIKATTNGHKRLLGCISGRYIVIKKYYPKIPESVSAYYRLVPDDLCK